VKSLRNVDLSEYLREWLAAGPKTKGNLKLEVDVDPQSFFVGFLPSFPGRAAWRGPGNPYSLSWLWIL